MSVSSIFDKMPGSIQLMARYAYGNIPLGLRLGRKYKETRRLLEKSQWWSKDLLENYQVQTLKALLNHVYLNVPYYSKIFNEYDLHPGDFQCLDDLKRLPFLTRDIIRENIDDFLAKNLPKSRLQYVTTGGSTGIPLYFYCEKKVTDEIEDAFIHTLWGRAGYRVGDKRIVLRGKPIREANNGKFANYNPVRRELSLSSYHMTDENLPEYIRIIKDFGARFIHAYPSSITILADFMKRNHLPPFPFLKAILVGSENLYDWQRALLEEVFQCRVYSWYGHAEKAVLAGECEECHHYHIFPEYGVTELVDSDGNEITGDGKIGEIIATGFNNYVMPFIRYRTMDLGVYGNGTCACGRNYPILKRIEGRLQELIVTGDDRMISMTAINMHNSLFDNVRQFQFYQENKGEVILSLVRSPSFCPNDDNRIRKEIGDKLGRNMKLHLKFVDEIPRTKSGKFRFLIQKLPVAHCD